MTTENYKNCNNSKYLFLKHHQQLLLQCLLSFSVLLVNFSVIPIQARFPQTELLSITIAAVFLQAILCLSSHARSHSIKALKNLSKIVTAKFLVKIRNKKKITWYCATFKCNVVTVQAISYLLAQSKLLTIAGNIIMFSS